MQIPALLQGELKGRCTDPGSLEPQACIEASHTLVLKPDAEFQYLLSHKRGLSNIF